MSQKTNFPDSVKKLPTRENYECQHWKTFLDGGVLTCRQCSAEYDDQLCVWKNEEEQEI
jgi:hypothetical protein